LIRHFRANSRRQASEEFFPVPGAAPWAIYFIGARL
jgi:hypothetical protein